MQLLHTVVDKKYFSLHSDSPFLVKLRGGENHAWKAEKFRKTAQTRRALAGGEKWVNLFKSAFLLCSHETLNTCQQISFTSLLPSTVFCHQITEKEHVTWKLHLDFTKQVSHKVLETQEMYIHKYVYTHSHRCFQPLYLQPAQGKFYITEGTAFIYTLMGFLNIQMTYRITNLEMWIPS